MANLPISQLPPTTGRTHNDLLAIVNAGVTKQINVENFLAEPVFVTDSATGNIVVDLNNYSWFSFVLDGNVNVTLQNQRNGYRYLFWVYANGNYSVTGMTLASGGDVFSVGGSLPNPANNKWNLYQGYAIDGDFILTEIGNFSAI